MAMTVEITSAESMGDLLDALTRGGCDARRIGATACHVSHPLATSDEEAWLELAFFVRAWQLEHPNVGASLLR